jgi:hypothetical protein
MNKYPLIFAFRDAISGNGFLSGVSVTGRALMALEDGKWWMYGVAPGGIAESGDTMQEAWLRFKNTYKDALFDMAEEAVTFANFKDLVRGFVNDRDDEEAERWHSALEELRSQSAAPDSQFAELPRWRAESHPPEVSVVRLDAQQQQFAASQNKSDKIALAEAA